MKIIHSKIFKILVILFIVGFILGIVSYFILKDESINSNIINYFDLFKTNDFDYFNGLIKSIYTNYKYLLLIMISGVLVLGVIISLLIILFRGISLGFLLISIIASFNVKGLLFCLILLFPCILINEIIYILSSYYSINFTIKEYNVIKNNKSINLKSFTKNYLYLFIIFSILLLLSSLFEIFISTKIIKYIV